MAPDIARFEVEASVEIVFRIDDQTVVIGVGDVLLLRDHGKSGVWRSNGEIAKLLGRKVRR